MILNIYSPDLKCFETLLKHYYVTSADFKRFVTFWKRLSSDSVGSILKTCMFFLHLVV